MKEEKENNNNSNNNEIKTLENKENIKPILIPKTTRNYQKQKIVFIYL